MTMFFVRTGGWEGCGVTKARALAGLSSAMESNNEVYEVHTVTVIEFYPEDYFGKQTDWHNPENWAKNITEIKISSTGIHELAERHRNMEKEGDIVNCTDDWRIDYGDENITYVIKSDNCIVGLDEHWDEAKESLKEVNAWDDGEDYYIEEVEDDLDLTFSNVN